MLGLQGAPPLQLLLLLLLLLAVPGEAAEAGAGKTVAQKEAAFDRPYTDVVNSELLNIYAFNHTVTRNRVSRPAGPWARAEAREAPQGAWGAADPGLARVPAQEPQKSRRFSGTPRAGGLSRGNGMLAQHPGSALSR